MRSHGRQIAHGGNDVAEKAKDAYDTLRQLLGDAVAKAALLRYEKAANHIRLLRDPVSFVAPSAPTWYAGPSPDDRFWPPLRNYLLEKKGWPEDTVNRIDEASTKILSLMEPPGLARVNTKGLVVGYVQSGKTANYSALIAKAADVGYRLIIVLAGIHNTLRKQTQERLEKELSGLNDRAWYALTNPNQDFRAGAGNNTNAVLNDESHLRILCVVKKNATVLKRLLKWLGAAHEDVLSACPVLIVDDEADQAGLNASRDPSVRTVINKQLLAILKRLPKVAYIGYTATPFANVLVDPSGSDLYPSTFIASLPRPPGYFGAESLFGRERIDDEEAGTEFLGLDMIRQVPDEEVKWLQPKRMERDGFAFDLTPSLEAALDYFLLAYAARRLRKQDEHSSMLVHTTLYAAAHETIAAGIADHWEVRRQQLRDQGSPVWDVLRTQWDEEVDRAREPEWGCPRHEFDELRPLLRGVADDICILVENGQSLTRLSYDGDAKFQIAVGGNTLSRGLTLEGLLVSYFIRTANAYDTLLQMGRWFGYRFGYQDLPRIWMTDELEDAFAMLATVEEEIRRDIARYEDENLTPTMFGVRIRTHPKLAITSKLKMQHAVDCEVSYANTSTQTRFFNHQNSGWLGQNLAATRRLLAKIGSGEPTKAERWRLFKGISAATIIDYLEDYRIHDEHKDITNKRILDYIRAQNVEGSLEQWNVLVASRGTRDDALGSLELGADLVVNLVNRSRINTPTPYANLGTITTQDYLTADLDGGKRHPGGPGLLTLVPISKDSRKEKGNRKALEAVEHVIGIALTFPPSDRPTPQKYKTVDLSRVPREVEDEYQDEEAASEGEKPA